MNGPRRESQSIRELGIADQLMLEELLDAIWGEWRNVLAPGASGPMSFIADSSTFAFGGYVDNEPAAFAWGSVQRRPNGETVAYLDELDVLEVHRRKGLGSLMVEAVVAWARRNQHSEVWVSARSDNTAAIALYQQLGADADPAPATNFTFRLV